MSAYKHAVTNQLPVQLWQRKAMYRGMLQNVTHGGCFFTKFFDYQSIAALFLPVNFYPPVLQVYANGDVFVRILLSEPRF